MGATYTKGEWNVVQVTVHPEYKSEQIAFIQNDRTCFDLSCIESEVMPREEFAANAHLISAAPKLLEALQALVASTYNGCSRKESQEQLEKAEAAITKALGGTNS